MTKKEFMRKAQELENKQALSLWNDMIQLFNDRDRLYRQHKKRLNKCEAFVLWHDVESDAKLYLLQSYRTVIAGVMIWYDAESSIKHCVCVDALRYEYGYTATSAQHIAKFFRQYAYDNPIASPAAPVHYVYRGIDQ